MPNLVKERKMKVGFLWRGGGGRKKPLSIQLELKNTPLETGLKIGFGKAV